MIEMFLYFLLLLLYYIYFLLWKWWRNTFSLISHTSTHISRAYFLPQKKTLIDHQQKTHCTVFNRIIEEAARFDLDAKLWTKGRWIMDICCLLLLFFPLMWESLWDSAGQLGGGFFFSSRDDRRLTRKSWTDYK